MIKYFKNLLTSFLIWIRPPKIGKIHLETPSDSLDQNIRVDQDHLEVNLDEWTETFKHVFETDHFVGNGLDRANRPSDEILKRQVSLFYKDYTALNKKVDELYTKTLKYNDEE